MPHVLGLLFIKADSLNVYPFTAEFVTAQVTGRCLKR